MKVFKERFVQSFLFHVYIISTEVYITFADLSLYRSKLCIQSWYTIFVLLHHLTVDRQGKFNVEITGCFHYHC